MKLFFSDAALKTEYIDNIKSILNEKNILMMVARIATNEMLISRFCKPI